jgi:hypothetical protein
MFNILWFLLGWLLAREGQEQLAAIPPDDDEEEDERWRNAYEN